MDTKTKTQILKKIKSQSIGVIKRKNIKSFKKIEKHLLYFIVAKD
ncbi:MAG: hypothetical protein ACJAX3_001993 [Patiriisocius sp.]